MNQHKKQGLAPLPWDEIIAIGLGQLRLSPQALWQMTPIEFTLALKGAGLMMEPVAICSRARLHSLMQQFPDQKVDQ